MTTLSTNFEPHDVICPSCQSNFCLSEAGGIYGLWHAEVDAVLLAVICEKCTPAVAAGSPERQALQARVIESLKATKEASDDYRYRIAFTTEKTLALHGGDIAAALSHGWTLPKREDYYDICVLPYGMVLVSEKEVDDA